MYAPWECPNCGNSSDAVEIGVTVTCKCGFVDRGCQHAVNSIPTVKGAPVPPGVAVRGYNYTKAWARWMLADCPERSDLEVNRIRVICGSCEYFDGELCVQCGCAVSHGTIFGDKVKWKTEHCPIGKW
jgi:hypothetical protein